MRRKGPKMALFFSVAGATPPSYPFGHHRFMTPDARAWNLATDQHGCISREQALACGLSSDAIEHRVKSQEWWRVLPRVYAVAAAPRTWELDLTAALLWLGPEAALSGASAVCLWNFPDCDPGPIEISHPGTSQGRGRVRVHRSVKLLPDEVTRRKGFRVTTPARTLGDMSARLSRDDLHAALHHCLHQRLTTIDRIKTACERQALAGRRGSKAFREACDVYSSSSKPVASHLEARVLRRLIAAGLPPPQRQYLVRLDDGTRRYLDFAWPNALVGLEADGYRWHSSHRAWRDDRLRLGQLQCAGWTIVHVTEEDVRAGASAVVREIIQLLAEKEAAP